MAFRKQMLLPFAALVFAGFIAVRAAGMEKESDFPETRSDKDVVAEELREGEAALQGLLGPEVETLDKMLKAMIEEMARAYGVSEKELAVVAKEVMQKISHMDLQTLQATLSRLGTVAGVDLNNPAALQELVGHLGEAGAGTDGI